MGIHSNLTFIFSPTCLCLPLAKPNKKLKAREFMDVSLCQSVPQGNKQGRKRILNFPLYGFMEKKLPHACMSLKVDMIINRFAVKK